jgi:23S rRNA (guanosine2251-2'-O)-methyltransferase
LKQNRKAQSKHNKNQYGKPYQKSETASQPSQRDAQSRPAKASTPKPPKGPDPDRLTRRNTVMEALRANRRKFKVLYMQTDMQDKLARPLKQAAKDVGVRIEEVEKNRLGNLAGAGDHQGVVLEVGDYPYCEVFHILERAKELGEAPFILIMDLVQGTYNVGTLLRTAEIVGVHGVIVQDRRAPEITPLIVQHSQGAAEHLRIAKVTNLTKALDELKAADVWVAGLDFGEDAQKLGTIDLNRPLAIVVGHEGDGIRRLVRDSCDFILEIPQRGQVESLNAAVAGSVALYSAWQARGF